MNRGGEGILTGLGDWTRANEEMCLLATRGSPQRLGMDMPQVIMTPVGEHSQKTEEARRRIERLLNGPLSRILRAEAGRRLDSLGRPDSSRRFLRTVR